MKKISVLLLTFMLATTALSAGNNNLPFIKFGAKFGIASEKQNVSFPTTWESFESILNDPSTGYHAGITARVKIPLIPIHVQGEFLYNWNNITILNSKLKTHYFSIPVLAGIGIGAGDMLRVRFNAGPVFNFGTKVSWNDNDLNFLDGLLDKPAVTWAAGVGLDLFGLMIDARYNGQFKKNKVETRSITASPSSWTFSLGFMF